MTNTYNMRKDLLQYINTAWQDYKVNAMIKLQSGSIIEGLPNEWYKEQNITLDIGNHLPIPTNIHFYDECFTIAASFDRVMYSIRIPYQNLTGIFDFNYKEGFLFASVMTEDEALQKMQPVQKKTNLKVVN